MSRYEFFHGFQLYHYVIYHYIHLVFLIKEVMLVVAVDFLLAFIINAPILQFKMQSLLIDRLKKTPIKFGMYVHSRSDDFVDYILIMLVIHIATTEVSKEKEQKSNQLDGCKVA